MLKEMLSPFTMPEVLFADLTSERTGGNGVIVGVGQKLRKVTVETTLGEAR